MCGWEIQEATRTPGNIKLWILILKNTGISRKFDCYVTLTVM